MTSSTRASEFVTDTMGLVLRIEQRRLPPPVKAIFDAVESGNASDLSAEKLWGVGETSELLVGRAEEGDSAALEALSGIVHLLGASICSFINVFATELTIVGGGFGIAASEFLLPEAHEVARREALEPARAGIRIVKAELGSDAGLIGAGLLAFEAIAKEG